MKKYLAILALLTLLSIVLFWPIFSGRVNLNGNLLVSYYAPFGQNLPFKNTGWDQLRIYFPFYNFTLSQFKSGSLPLWNPYAFSGHPHAADFQSAIFYPLNIFGLFLPQIEFWHLLRITPAILAAFFTFIFLRNWKLGFWPSLFGGLAFGFSPFVITWGEEVVMAPHTIVWLPLILFFCERYFEKKRNVYILGAALAWTMSLLGGYMQTSIYLAVFVAAYMITLHFPKKSNYRLWIFMVSFFLLGTFAASIQIFPSAELFFNSSRNSISLTGTLYQFLLPLKSLITFLVPDYFGHPGTMNYFRGGSAQYYESILFAGVGSFVLGLYAFLFLHKDKKIWFLAVAFLVSLISSLAIPTSKLFLLLPVPFLSTSIANRVLFIPAFCLIIASSFALHKWMDGKTKKLPAYLAVFGFIYIFIIVYHFGVRYLSFPYWSYPGFEQKIPEYGLISLRNTIIPAIVFGALFIVLIFFKNKRLGAFVIAALAFAHIFYFSNKYLTFNERGNIFPQTQALEFLLKNQGYNRSWGLGKASFANNFATQYGIYWAEGYDSLNNRSYGEFTYAMQGHKIDEFIFRADAGLGSEGNIEGVLDNERRMRLVDMLSIKYFLGHKDEFSSFEKRGYEQVFESGNFGIFENGNAVPRAFLASHYEGPPDVFIGGETEKERREKERLRRKLIFNKLLDPDFDIRNTVILEKPSPVSPQSGVGISEITTYKPMEVVVRTKSEAPKLLILTDNWYPGWKVEVDGAKTEILRANYTFRAAPLIAGEHTVRFYYDPLSFKLGLYVSIISLGLLLVLTFKKLRRVD